MSIQPTPVIKNEPEPGTPPSFRRIWLVRIAFGLALLLAFKIGYDFFKHFYYTDEIPSWRDLAKQWNVLRAAELIHNPGLIGRALPRSRVVLFVVLLWTVLLSAGVVLIYEYGYHFATAGRRFKRTPVYIWFRNVVVGLAVFGALCLTYGFYVEPYWLQVTHVRVPTLKIAAGGKPIRIVLFSDLHMGRKLRLEPRLPGVIREQHPDLIVFTGDAMNTSWALGKFKQFILNLHDIAPVIVVLGNQDQGPYWPTKNIYGGTQAVELSGQALTMNIRGTELYFWGQPFSPPTLIQPDPAPPPGAFTILLHHAPDLMEGAVRANFDLYLAGHTHGGQVALPFYGALVTYSRYDKKYESGVYHEGNTTLYVNRGIGLAKWPQPEARFFARPEITVIDLVPAGS